MLKYKIPQIVTLTRENVGKNRANKKAKYLLVKYLAFLAVPRPAFEILNINR